MLQEVPLGCFARLLSIEIGLCVIVYLLGAGAAGGYSAAERRGLGGFAGYVAC